MKDKENRFMVLFITTLSSFLTAFAASSIIVALPSIGAEFNADAISLNWIVTSFLLTTAVFMMPSGRLGDIAGRRKVFAFGVMIYVLSAAAAYLSKSVMILIAARVIQGIGGAMTAGTAAAILVASYPLEERGRVIGINTAAVYTGLSAGPFLGGIMTKGFGWRSIFLVNIAVCSLIVALIAGMLRGEEVKINKKTGITGLLKIDMHLFLKNRVFLMSNLAALINYSATFAVSFFVSLYLQLIKHKSAGEAGMILVVQPVLQALFSPVSGRLSDRIEPRYLSSSGMALCAAGLFMLIFLSGETTTAYTVFCLSLLGIGFALFSSPNTNAVMSSVTKDYLGAASSAIGTMRVIGQMASMAVALFLFSIFIGNAVINGSNAGMFLKSSAWGFGIFSILCTAGIFASMARGNVRISE